MFVTAAFLLFGLLQAEKCQASMCMDTKRCSGVSLDSVTSMTPAGVRRVFDTFIPGLGQKEVLCDESTDGGDWIIFQLRMDGSVDFFRDWADYVNGFGNLKGEFWLGLKAIRQLVTEGPQQLRVDMKLWNGDYYYAQYDSFSIGPASDNYRLSLSGYSGNATDALILPPSTAVHNGMQFSARDKDHDRSNVNCAQSYKGGWWYNACHWVNLNGLYDVTGDLGMRWRLPTGPNLLAKSTELKLRHKK